jgi:hypothetical protein
MKELALAFTRAFCPFGKLLEGDETLEWDRSNWT